MKFANHTTPNHAQIAFEKPNKLTKQREFARNANKQHAVSAGNFDMQVRSANI